MTKVTLDFYSYLIETVNSPRNCLRQRCVQHLNVLREPRQDAPSGRLVEELERGSEDAQQQGHVQQNRGTETTQLWEEVTEKRKDP